MSKFRRIKDNVRSSSPTSSNEHHYNRNSSRARKVAQTKVMPHDEFIKRVQKSLYFGNSRMSIPLSDYMSDMFSDTHRGYSLNRLNYATVGRVRTPPYSLILAMIYLERLKETDPAYTKHITPTELFLVSMMVATKFYSGHDEDVSLSDWAEYGNMTHEQLVQVELEFLSALNWNIYVSNEEFFDRVHLLEGILAKRQGLHRGWFTYTEMNSLLPALTIAKSLMQLTMILAMGYAAFVATIIGSVFLASQVPGTSLHSASKSTGIASTPKLQKADLIHSTLTPEADETLLFDAHIDLNDRLHCDFDRLSDFESINSTNSSNLEIPLLSQIVYNQLLNLPMRLFRKAEVGLRAGVNLRSMNYDENLDESNDVPKKINMTEYELLMDEHHQKINANIPSCNKNELGVVFQWRKLL